MKHSMVGLELENAIRLYLQQHAHTDSADSKGACEE